MTLRHMRIFGEVYRTGSVTRAAESLHMTQPAVTRAVQELEQHYGVRLFERMYRRLTPTEAAQRLYPQAVYLLDTFDRMERELQGWDAHGTVRVGATVTLGSTLLPTLAKAFAAQYPDITLQVQVANGRTLADALCDNRLDLALLENGVPVPELHSEPLGEDRLCAVMAPDGALAGEGELTLEQLAGQPLLVRERGSTARAVLESAFTQHGLTLHPAWESVSADALVQAAAKGLGVAVLPEPVAAQSAADGRVVVCLIRGTALLRRHVLVWHKEKYLTAAMERFIEMCRERTE